MSWTDNFDGGTGALDDRSGWGSSRDTLNNTAMANAFALASDMAKRDAFREGAFCYILADSTPSSADYFVQVDAYSSTEGTTATHLASCFIRGAVGASGGTGYGVDVDVFNNELDILKYVNGTKTVILNNDPITALNWLVAHTIKLVVSGSATTTLTVFIDGNQESTFNDTSSPITAAGQGGLIGYWEAADNNITYYDNFSIDDGGGGATPINSPFSDSFGFPS